MSSQKEGPAESVSRVTQEKIKKDPGLRMQQYFDNSESPEEILFKINELLYSSQHRDTRKYIRAPISMPVKFKLDGKQYKSMTYTVSQRGVFIKSPDPPGEGVAIEVELFPPDGAGVIEAAGEVVQSSPIGEASERMNISGMAVVFNKINRENRRRLDRLARSYNKKMLRGEA